MKNRLLGTGILIIVIVFGMTVVGCGGETDTWRISTNEDIPQFYNTNWTGFDGTQNITVSVDSSGSVTIFPYGDSFSASFFSRSCAN